MITSVSEPPTWKPKLPPSIRTVPGADQPARLLLLQERYPFPYFPPKTKAPVLRPGTITMQCAFSRRSSGVQPSGAAIASERTSADSCRRLVGSLSSADSGARAIAIDRSSCVWPSGHKGFQHACYQTLQDDALGRRHSSKAVSYRGQRTCDVAVPKLRQIAQNCARSQALPEA